MDSFSSQGSSTTAIESKSYTYAELLLNIRQVTVSLSLDPPSHKSTKLCLSSDRQGLELSHDGHEYTIRLPAKVIHPQRSANQSLLLAIPSSPSKEFSVRLPLDGDAHPRASAPHHTENEMPWTAAKLPVPVQLQCCHCANVLTQYGAIRAWKDLPSDSWAEMMDFWHCHKPAEHTNAKNHDTSEMDKGYAASNKLIARSGVGFVDLCYFLFYAADVTGVNIQHSHDDAPPHQSQNLLCSNCKAVIGTLDDRAEGYRLHKWSLALHSPHTPTPTPTSYPLQRFISAHLISLISSQAVRRFVLTSSQHVSGLELWVFNPDLYYTSTSVPTPQRAMKVFSKPIPNPRELLETRSASHEEVNLPEDVYERVRKVLERSAVRVFESSRGFEGWDAGLLERFDGEGEGEGEG